MARLCIVAIISFVVLDLGSTYVVGATSGENFTEHELSPIINASYSAYGWIGVAIAKIGVGLGVCLVLLLMARRDDEFRITAEWLFLGLIVAGLAATTNNLHAYFYGQSLISMFIVGYGAIPAGGAIGIYKARRWSNENGNH